MKASELIEILQHQIEIYGDLPVVKPVYREPDQLYPEYEYICDAGYVEEKDAYDKCKSAFIEIF